LDIALALSQRSSELRIRAWVPTRLPKEVDGRPLARCVWEPVSALTAARAVLSGEAPPRGLLEHARRARPWHRGRQAQRAAAVLEVVNGLGAHALLQAALPDPAEIPRMIVVHESPRHFDEPGRLDLATAQRALRSYDYRVYVSQRGQKEWDSLAGLDGGRSFYIPNCVREQRVAQVLTRPRSELRRSLGYSPDRVYALCVGQVSVRKGQDLLLSELDGMPAGPSEVQLDFLGDQSSAWAKALQAGLEGSPVAGRVRFLGKVSDVYERVYAADLLVLASRAEASPLVVLEAMALGTCVVAADVDGVGEQVVDEETGLLFHRDNVQELRGSLMRLTRDAALRERLARGGRARYLERFTRDRQLARWSAALRAALESGFASSQPA
jgi:glycosyltransferase involved in cell wall biosynthesis